MASTFRATPVKKLNVDLLLTPIRLRRAAVLAVRKCDVPLKVPGMIVDMYVTGLMLFGPYEEERYGLAFGWKYKWLIAIAAFNAPAR